MSVFLTQSLRCPNCDRDDHLEGTITYRGLFITGGVQAMESSSSCVPNRCGNCGYEGDDFMFDFHGTELSYKFDSAMSLWEAALQNPKVNAYAEIHGWAGARDTMTEHVENCERAWTYARTRGFDAPFDWDFCPVFIQACLTEDLVLLGNWAERLDEALKTR